MRSFVTFSVGFAGALLVATAFSTPLSNLRGADGHLARHAVDGSLLWSVNPGDARPLDFEKLWETVPQGFDKIRVMFEVRCDNKRAGEGPVHADVYYDDLYWGPALAK